MRLISHMIIQTGKHFKLYIMKKYILLLGFCFVAFGISAQTALDNYKLANNDTIQKRVIMLSLKIATQVTGETVSSSLTQTMIDKRHDFALRVFYNHDWAKNIISSTIFSLGTLNKNSTDSDLEYTIVTIWDDLSGIKQKDKP